MTSKLELRALQYSYATRSFEENFETLCRLLKRSSKDSFTLAPELCLSAYSYEQMDEIANKGIEAINELESLSKDKAFALTLITKNTHGFENTLIVFENGNIIHKQAKTRLFKLGDEEKYFIAGDEDAIKIITVNGIKIAFLICFELRFSELWQKILGADIICIPSFWGLARKEHLKTLSEALAVMNQAFVVVANSSDDDMASSSGIITPFGNVFRDDSSMIISHEADLNELKKMRRYIQIG